MYKYFLLSLLILYSNMALADYYPFMLYDDTLDSYNCEEPEEEPEEDIEDEEDSEDNDDEEENE